MSLLNKLCASIPSSKIDALPCSFEELVLILLEHAQKQETSWLQQFFECVEQELIFADREDQNVLIIELLEGLKNQASLRDIDYVIFENWLGPETHVAWRWLEKKWQGKTSLADSASGL
jgi:hypothetical protein